MKTCFFNDVIIWSNGKSRPPFHPFQNGLRKQPTFCNAFTGFPAKWHLRNKCRYSILICRVITQIWVVLLIGWKLLHPIRSAVVLHQYGISALVSQTSFRRETSGGVMKYWLFSWRLISMEFLHWFVRHHCAGKPVVAPQSFLFSQAKRGLN